MSEPIKPLSETEQDKFVQRLERILHAVANGNHGGEVTLARLYADLAIGQAVRIALSASAQRVVCDA